MFITDTFLQHAFTCEFENNSTQIYYEFPGSKIGSVFNEELLCKPIKHFIAEYVRKHVSIRDTHNFVIPV